jgi:TetR/AcrR family transcriptional regulator, transcriptional repressor for nem operon
LTDLLEPRAGKRERLVTAAAELMYRRGVGTPTIAEIARAAQVPPGNVYYYFKTRDDLVAAVVEARVAGIRALLSSLERTPDPRARLKALANVWIEQQDDIATHGCPMGTLCSELNKSAGPGHGAAAIFAVTAEWIAAQFRQLGQPDARELAMSMLSTVQGAAVLAATLHDPLVLTGQIRRMQRWIDSLARRPPPTRTAARRMGEQT